jgi:hypothetical protein
MPWPLRGLREGDVDLHNFNSVQCLHCAPSVPHEPPRIIGLNTKRKLYVPGVTHLQPLDVPTLYDIAAGLGMANAGQCLEYTCPEVPITHFDSLEEVLIS